MGLYKSQITFKIYDNYIELISQYKQLSQNNGKIYSKC